MLGLSAWLPKGEEVSYCPQHNEISFGYFKAHYCESSIDLGNTDDSYEEQLEKDLHKANRMIQHLTEALRNSG
jgi:hypothetical protein